MLIILFVLALLVVLVAPAALSLTPAGYDFMPPAHVVAFVLAAIVLVWMGRAFQRRGHHATRRGLGVGAMGGALGALGSQVLMHTPAATAAFVVDLAGHGVPPAAALTIQHLHMTTSAILTALIATVFYGALGAIAGWWGARQWIITRRRQPTPSR